MSENQGHKFIQRGSQKGKGIALFTSGGDSQGMNAAVRSVVRMGIYLGCKVYFIREGYQGMVDGGDHIVETSWCSVSSIIHMGGTIIGSARCKEFTTREGQLKAAKNLINRGITNLVVIGGDGSLTGAYMFHKNWCGLIEELVQKGEITSELMEKHKQLNIVGLVGSIDNDFCGTDMTIGSDSALHRIVEAVDAIGYTAYSHQRTFIMEVMGRHCGYLALVGALATEADYLFVPEAPAPADWQNKLTTKLMQERATGKRLNIIIVAEGAIDNQGNSITVEQVKTAIVSKIHQDTRVTVLGHVQRGGRPSAFDRILGSRMGAEAVMALVESGPGAEPLVVTLDGNKAVRLPLMQCVERTREVTTAMANKQFEKAVELRGKSFMRNLDTYKRLSKLKPPKEEGKPGRIYGVVHIGAPAGGMNAAVGSFVRSAIYNGDSVIGIRDGIEGFIAENIKPLHWADVIGWISEGGAILGTKRSIPGENMGIIAERIEKHNLHGLLIIGGFEAYQAALQMLHARDQYSALNIPIAVVPSTISNNIPGTEFSLGCDTALNEITEICDRIRQSAQGTKRRVFVIETMGGYCGYLATLAGLAGGADSAYIFEEKFSIKDLQQDVYHMATKMAAGVQRGLILRNEKASENYDTLFIHKLYSEEGKGLFSSRMNILGHMQQGGIPSPFDRNMATKMGSKAAVWMSEQLKDVPLEGRPCINTPESVILIGVVGKRYVYTPVEKIIENTDLEHRIPKRQWWLKLRPLLRILAQHESTYQEEGMYMSEEEVSKE